MSEPLHKALQLKLLDDMKLLSHTRSRDLHREYATPQSFQTLSSDEHRQNAPRQLRFSPSSRP